MSTDSTEINLPQLRKALQQAASSAERQSASLRGFLVADEVADDIGNQIRWVLQDADVRLTNEQWNSLSQLGALLDHMSAQHNARLWTEEALRSRTEWDAVRRMARKALESFGWPLEDAGASQDERIMLREALRVAALPIDQQIASFPEGSPVPEWIAGDFFNWSALALRRADFVLTDRQRAALMALDARLNKLSEKHERDPELWTVAGLQHRPEWNDIRRDAHTLLELLGWGPDDDGARLKNGR